MDISIFGLGMSVLFRPGVLPEKHKVIGVDPNQTKVDLINSGQTPIIEKDIGELISKFPGR